MSIRVRRSDFLSTEVASTAFLVVAFYALGIYGLYNLFHFIKLVAPRLETWLGPQPYKFAVDAFYYLMLASIVKPSKEKTCHKCR